MDINSLVTQQVHASSPMLSATPVLPEEGLRADLERMQEDADATWFLGIAAMPLTLFAHSTAPTEADASRIHQRQAAIGLAALLGGTQQLSNWAAQGAIGLKGEVVARETARRPKRWQSRRQERWALSQGHIRWCVVVQAPVDALMPEAGSRPTARRSARLLVPKGHENTNGQGLAPSPTRRGLSQKPHDAGRVPPPQLP